MLLGCILVSVMPEDIRKHLSFECCVVAIELLGDVVLVADALLLGFERQVGGDIRPCEAEIEQTKIVLGEREQIPLDMLYGVVDIET